MAGGRAEETGGTSRRAISITAMLASLLIVFAVLLGGTLIAFNYQRDTRAALLSAESALDRTAEDVAARANEIVRPIAVFVRATAALDAVDARTGRVSPGVERYLMEMLQSLRRITSVYFGFANGDFIQYVDLKANPRWRFGDFDPPSNAALVRRSIDHQAGGPVMTIAYLDAGLHVVELIETTAVDLEPRTRPWYRAAIETDGVAKVGPYEFATSREIGTTIAKEVANRPGTVFGVDFTLSGLSAFLKAQRPSEDSLIAMITPQGEVLAYAEPARSSNGHRRELAGERALPGFGELDDPLAVAAYRYLFVDRLPLPSVMTIDGRDYLARLKTVAGPIGAADVLVVVPADVFTGSIRRLSEQSVLISLGLLIATIPGIVAISRVLSRPMKSLAGEAEAIRNFRLDAPISVHTRVTEVNELADSMDRMKAGIRSFGIYVPRGLVQHALEHRIPPSLGGTRREITVLFTDIADFTPVAEGPEPEEVMRRLSEYFEALTAVLRDNGAIIDKFIGDAVMAVWNAITPDPNHVTSACRAVIQARAACDAFGLRLAARGLPPMPTRFGLHTGEAVVGNVGSSERMSFTALGAIVNLAARLEPLNKHFGTTMLVSDAVAVRTREQFCLRTAGLVRPKGVAEPLRVHELICEAGDRATHPIAMRGAEWEAAFESYVAGDWSAAASAFAAFADAFPDDALTRRYAERAKHLSAAPPAGAWDPVEAFDTK